ncbi:hypothetical protein RI065_11370 [Mycoplasmatota bacterium zrk1]
MKKFICLFLFIKLIIIVSADIIDESMVDEIDGDYIVEDDFELILSEKVELAEYGKNIIFKDVCVLDDGFIAVGGAVRLGDYYGGLDGIIVKYKDDEIEWFRIFGGSNSDIFNSVYCGEEIVVAGESFSVDHDLLGNTSSNFKSGLFLALDLNGELKWLNSHEEKLDFTISSVDYKEGYIFSGYMDTGISDDAFIFKVDDLGNIVMFKSYSYTGDDIIHDILVDKSIILVGSTTTTDFGVTGQRGFIMELNDDFELERTYTDRSSSISIYSNIDKIKSDIYVSGSVGKHEKQEFSNSKGIVGIYDGEFNGINTDLNIVTGVSETSLGNIIYGGTIKKEKYIPKLSIDEVEFTANGVIIDVIESDGIKVIYTDSTSVNKGVVESVNFISGSNNELYLNNNLIELDELYIGDPYRSDIFGEYKKCSYAEVSKYNYYSDLLIDKVEFYTNINKTLYYDSVNLFFNGIGYLNGELIETGFQLTETGEYELIVTGANNAKKVLDFEVRESVVQESKFYNFSEEKEYFIPETIDKDFDYRYLLVGVCLIPAIIYWYKRKK